MSQSLQAEPKRNKELRTAGEGQRKRHGRRRRNEKAAWRKLHIMVRSQELHKSSGRAKPVSHHGCHHHWHQATHVLPALAHNSGRSPDAMCAAKAAIPRRNSIAAEASPRLICSAAAGRPKCAALAARRRLHSR